MRGVEIEITGRWRFEITKHQHSNIGRYAPAVVKMSGPDHSSTELFEEDENAKLCINTVRVLSADMVEKANSGHPGAPMGCAPMAHILFSEVMKYSPSNPRWTDRDRFVLSNGHSCALLYSMLHLTGTTRIWAFEHVYNVIFIFYS